MRGTILEIGYLLSRCLALLCLNPEPGKVLSIPKVRSTTRGTTLGQYLRALLGAVPGANTHNFYNRNSHSDYFQPHYREYVTNFTL